MNKKVVVRPSMPSGYSRSNSIGSSSSNSSNSNTTSSSASIIPSPPSSEMCSLIGFAYRLGSVVHNSDLSMDGSNSDVHREAKLLMSLSCSSPIHTKDERAGGNNSNNNINADTDTNSNNSNQNNNSDSKNFDVEVSTMTSAPHSSTHSSASSIISSMTSTGRITPTHSVTSTSSGGSRRDTFCFTCPSLSLENTRGFNSNSNNSPGVMLSRTLRVDDKDAMRLSSEAMARNIIESFQKAIVWRIQVWMDSLSRVLVIKENELKKNSNNKGYTKALQELYFSNEALLVKTLREIEGKVQVLEANTAFKVLNKVSLVDETGSALKKPLMGEEEDRTGLEEGEYVYDVTHVLEMQCSLNICTPAGNVSLDLNVPGKIKGTFFSSADDESENKLTDVTINLNTEMMASMIEKSSRIAVRVSSEALLNGNARDSVVETAPHVSSSPQEAKAHTSPAATTRLPTRSPKRKFDDQGVSRLVVITPARNIASSPSSFGESSDSDGDTNHPVLLQIPNNFTHSEKIVQPQASRAGIIADVATPGTTAGLEFAARLAPKKYMLHKKAKSAASAVVTPLKTKGPEYIEREKGPNLPIFLETVNVHSLKK